jgi:probable rRNA maturation factor
VSIESHLDDDDDQDPLPRLPGDTVRWLDAAVTSAAWLGGGVEGEIEVAIIDDPAIRRLNRQHLDHDWETDVISFPYCLEPIDEQSSRYVVQGELIVSWQTAVREAPRTGWPPLTELILYAIHGTLHLVGMEDHNPSARQKMRDAEVRVLSMLCPTGYALYDVADSRRRSERGGPQ